MESGKSTIVRSGMRNPIPFFTSSSNTSVVTKRELETRLPFNDLAADSRTLGPPDPKISHRPALSPPQPTRTPDLQGSQAVQVVSEVILHRFD